MPVIPQHTLSKLDYVFIDAYFKSKYAKKYGNDPFLKPLVDVFKSLEETGIEISTNEGPIKEYFITSNILGDNLGQNEVLGFTTSFKLTFNCRFCTLFKPNTAKEVVALPQHLRTKENYEDALALNDLKATGITAVFLILLNIFMLRTTLLQTCMICMKVSADTVSAMFFCT